MEEEHLDLLPALEEKTLERRRRSDDDDDSELAAAVILIVRWEHGEDTPIPNPPQPALFVNPTRPDP